MGTATLPRRRFLRGSLALAGLGLLSGCGLPLPQGQPTAKVHRIGYLSTADRATDSPRSEAFREGLRELGYIEGRNIAFEYRYAEGNRDRSAEQAAELVRLGVDVIVAAGGDSVIRAAMQATGTIPIVLGGGGSEPVAAGYVESLARPGGNVTGVSTLSRDLDGKRLELFKETVPNLARVAALYDPGSAAAAREAREDLPVAARALGLTVQPWEIRDADGLETALAALDADRPDGLYLIASGALILGNAHRINGFAVRTRLPSMVGNSEAVESGGLLYYGADQLDGYRLAARYVDRILKGARPADLPVEQPTKLELVINLKTAHAIGLTLPTAVLARADKLIE